ncbi:MAG: enoyl-CoA hydratase/isomerase [Actinomycetia bacterium]|nr:enoyl-CoA hydratase/isomerase [Actinomycetes bacterium]
MADDEVLYEVRDGGVAVVTFNRPDRLNAWTLAMETQYFDALATAEADGDVRAIVVTGAGRGFCAGADMDLLSGGPGGLAGAERRPGVFAATLRTPLIGAINGPAAGVGLAQALLFDVRFAASGAKLTFSFPQRGLVAEYGSSWTLPRLVGTGRALDLLLSARLILAEEALALGLVNWVVPVEEVVDAAVAYGRQLAANCSPASMAVIKAQVARDWDNDLLSAGHEATKLMVRSFGGPDFVEGVQSYLQKRPAAFLPLGEGSPADLDV